MDLYGVPQINHGSPWRFTSWWISMEFHRESMDLHGCPWSDGSPWTSTNNWWISMDVHELMDLYGVPQIIDGSPWKSTYCGCTRESMEVHGGVIWCVKCRLSLHRAGSNLCHSARKVSYVKGTEWGRIGAKRRKRLGAASTFSRRRRRNGSYCCCLWRVSWFIRHWARFCWIRQWWEWRCHEPG